MRIKQNILDLLMEKADFLRQESMKLISHGKFGHPGGSLSLAEIIACLYFYPILKIDPKNPNWEERDRFIISKAHGCPPQYIALAERGLFPEGEVSNYGCINSILQGHRDMLKTPGIDISGGSLGQGLSVSVGMAIGAKFLKKYFNVYCIIGDGEIQSGQIWEAAMSAAHYKLDNITGIIDYNKVQAKGSCHDIMSIEPVKGKWQDFGWETIEIDGHDIEQIINAFHISTHINLSGKPTMIIAHTIKGRGVPWMENNSEWHAHAPNSEQLCKALKDLKKYSKGEHP